MAWLPGRDETLLVAESIVPRSSQTWTFDGVAWTRRSPLHQPPPFGFQALVHQPLRDRCTPIHPISDLVTGLPPAELWDWDGDTQRLEVQAARITPGSLRWSPDHRRAAISASMVSLPRSSSSTLIRSAVTWHSSIARAAWAFARSR